MRKKWDAHKYDEDHLDIHQKALRVAYGYKGLGNHLYGSRHLVEELCEEELDLWQDVLFSPNNIVIGGFGVDNHERFVELVDKYLGNRQNVDSKNVKGNRFNKRTYNYVGGDNRESILDANSTSIFIGFNSPGYNQNYLADLTVLQVLLGDSNQFSSGGPGKGMHSILNKLLSRVGFISDIKVHNQVFSDGGLFGIEATSLDNK